MRVLAGEHLRGLGHQKMAVLSGPLGHGNCVEQTKGILKGVSNADGPPPIVMSGPPSFDGGYRMARKLIEQNIDTTTILAANEVTAFGVIRGSIEPNCKMRQAAVQFC